MKHIHLLLPDVTVAKRVVDELLLAHVKWENIHILANSKISLEDLPEADTTQKSDLLAALDRGIAVGGLAGMLAGLMAIAIPAAGITLAGGAILAITLGGAGVGAWTAAMIGVSLPNSRLEQFQDAVDSGELLMIVDVPELEVQTIKSIILAKYPNADFHATHQNQATFVS